jgi:apolipoprotein N-acyltransferase
MTKKIKLKKYLYLPLISGVLLALSRLPLHLGFLAFFAFIPIFILFENSLETKKVIIGSLIFSTCYTLISLYWISLVTFGGFLGLFVLFGFYFIIYFGAVNIVAKNKPEFTNMSIIIFWMIFEYLQNYGELRFPWFDLGYSMAEYDWLIQLADIGGVYLVSLFILLLNYSLFIGFSKIKKVILLSVLLLAIWLGYGVWRINSLPVKLVDKSISLVQASIPQDFKWEESFSDSTIKRYRRLDAEAMKSMPDLIVWPESALPDYLLQRRSKFSRFLYSEIDKYKVNFFTGFPRYEIAKKGSYEPYKFYNSATLFNAFGGYQKPYDKMILVPVGERMPFLDIFPILWKLQLGQANFSYGKEPAYFHLDEYSFSSLICFEIAFPHLTNKIMEKPVDFIVNITNDAWFKRSAGTYQHAMMTKFRAVEIRRSIYRAANTGYSMIISPTGKIIKKTELFEQTTLDYPLIVCDEISFFTKYFMIFPIVFALLFFYIMISIILVRINK